MQWARMGRTRISDLRAETILCLQYLATEVTLCSSTAFMLMP
jgi:hypothetical protein